MSYLTFRVSRIVNRELKRRYPRLYGIREVGPEPPINLESSNAQGTFIGQFEDDGMTGYLYILDAKTRETVAACWLYNRVKALPLPEALAQAEQGFAPPLPHGSRAGFFCPRRKSLTAPTIQVSWNPSGDAVFFNFKGKAIGLLSWDGFQWRSYPRQLFESCKWGEPMTKEIKARFSLS